MKLALISSLVVLAALGCKDDSDKKGSGDGDNKKDAPKGDTDSSAPPPVPVCEDGQSRCEGQILQRCRNGFWASVEACALTGKRCVVGESGAGCVAADQETDTGSGQASDTGAPPVADAGTQPPEETEPVIDTSPRSVQIGFCNTVASGNSTEIEFTVELGQGQNKKIFRANTGCCDLCATMMVDPEMPAVLYNGDAVLYETVIPFTAGVEHLIVAILDERRTPALAYINLEEEEKISCEHYSRNAYGFCADQEETDPDAGESPAVDAGR